MRYQHDGPNSHGRPFESGPTETATCGNTSCITGVARLAANTCGGGRPSGCGALRCPRHLSLAGLCAPCQHRADQAHTWTNPATGQTFDLREDYLPHATPFLPNGAVWRHTGELDTDGTPLLRPHRRDTGRPCAGFPCRLAGPREALHPASEVAAWQASDPDGAVARQCDHLAEAAMKLRDSANSFAANLWRRDSISAHVDGLRHGLERVEQHAGYVHALRAEANRRRRSASQPTS